MIVSCTACETRYLVDDAELGGETGRRVRCSSCGNLWHYSAEAAAIHMAVAAVTAQLEAAQTGGISSAAAAASMLPPMPALRAEPGTQVQPLPSATAPLPVRAVVAVELPGAGGSHNPRWAWFGVLALAAAGIAIIVLSRDNLRALYPPIASLYQRVGLAAAAPPLQLATTLNRTPEAVIVLGTIANTTAQPQPVGGLRVRLRDGDNRDLAERAIAPPVALLLPGVTAQYSATFEHPSITAVAADVAFTER